MALDQATLLVRVICRLSNGRAATFLVTVLAGKVEIEVRRRRLPGKL
jgi:hypothetical protein